MSRSPRMAVLLGVACSIAADVDAEVPAAPAVRVYARLLDPREHPDDSRRAVKPPSWATFGGRTRFTCLRGFEVRDGAIVGFAEDLEKYTRKHSLGDVIWPSYPILFAKNLGELAEEIRRRDLFLFDIWGFVPGSGPGGYWQQFRPPPEALALLGEILDDRWLGMDVGEQDGRYVGGYASQMVPRGGGRLEQYLQFQRHFQRLTEDLGNRMAALVSLNFGHYFLKEGVYTLLGAETAQGLPNSQVYYAFIRGAGKEYGVPWFGNASVFNRWGWKVYGSEGGDGGYRFGPTKGTSLSLLKRLLYTHILYNSVLVGFENGWLLGDELTPIGRIQEAAHRWVKEHGSPGVMVAPVGLLLDFFSGWSFPRHLYTGDVYRVWGNLPYEAGDHLTDGVLGMLWPRYQDSSYFHDESGFLTPTPYGDAADCLLSDAPGWVLERYALLVAAGRLAGGEELREKLEAYVAGGGRLAISAGNLERLPGGLAGVRVAGPSTRLVRGATVTVGAGGGGDEGEDDIVEPRAFDVLPLVLPEGARILARVGSDPSALAAEVPWGAGSVIVLASLYGVAVEPAIDAGAANAATACAAISSEIDRPLPNPFPLLEHVRSVLDRALRDTMLFEVGDGLGSIACRKGPGAYTVGITNSSLRPLSFGIRALRGEIAAVREIPLDASERGAPGWLPEGFEEAPVGQSDAATIAGGDVRIFSVTLRRDDAVEILHRAPPARPRGRFLVLRDVRSIQEEVLSRPTFFERFDGVVLDWRYPHRRSGEAVAGEAGWIRRQGLRVAADLSSGLNLYPDLRLAKNIPAEWEASRRAISDVLGKLALLGGRDLVLSLHRFPENNMSAEETLASFDSSLREICAEAAEKGVMVHLRVSPGKFPWSLEDALGVLGRVAASNLRLAPSVGTLLAEGSATLPEAARGKIGMWMLGAPLRDVAGRVYTVEGPVAGSGREALALEVLRCAPEAIVALDAVLGSRDEEYREARMLEASP